MFSIKFSKERSVSVKKQIEIILKLCKILKVEKEELFYSDYTFEKVEESISINFIEDGIFSKEIDSDNLKQSYVSLEGIYENKKLKVEINPPISRRNVENCSNIDFNIIDESSIYPFFKKYIKEIEITLNEYTFISEFYFIDLNKTTNCYSDEKNRIYQKQNNQKDFSDLLLDKEYDKFQKLERENFKNICYNIMEEVYSDVSSKNSYIQNLIQSNNFNVVLNSGSLIIEGKDTEKFLNFLKEHILKVSYDIKKKQENIYSNSFKKYFK